jgi:hypothetical protein
MAPLTWSRLKAGDIEWPESVVSTLHQQALQEASLDLLRTAELTKLLDALFEIDVQPLLLKGTPLSYALYPATGLRPRCDTDLLIPESARDAVDEVMTRMGYKPFYEASADYINSQVAYFTDEGPASVNSYDVHWLISNNNREFSRKFSYERLMANALDIPELGKNAFTLNFSDALVLACFHRAGHYAQSGDRLIWLYDIHLLCEKLSREESVSFSNTAKELEIVQLSQDAIRTAQSWFGTSLNPALISFLNEQPQDETSSAYLQSGRAAGIKNRAYLELRNLSTLSERVAYVFQNLFPPPAYMRWRYGEKRKAVLPWLYFRRLMDGASILFK